METALDRESAKTNLNDHSLDDLSDCRISTVYSRLKTYAIYRQESHSHTHHNSQEGSERLKQNNNQIDIHENEIEYTHRT